MISKTASLGLAGLALALGGWWTSDRLPARAFLVPQVFSEPLQTPTNARPFEAQVGGVEYRIKPLYDYELTGLVVSRHHSDAWWDWIHAASRDHLNVVDLCVVWGANADSGAYQKMRFSSGQFVCYYQYDDAETGQAQNVRALSNNHLLTADPAIARRLRGLNIGDQIRLRGTLAEYAHDSGMAFTRGSSTSRDDTGNGACETVFVREADVLRRAGSGPTWAWRLGLALLVFALALAIAAPHRSRS